VDWDFSLKSTGLWKRVTGIHLSLNYVNVLMDFYKN
jgi:hypothetical protein